MVWPNRFFCASLQGRQPWAKSGQGRGQGRVSFAPSFAPILAPSGFPAFEQRCRTWLRSLLPPVSPLPAKIGSIGGPAPPTQPPATRPVSLLQPCTYMHTACRWHCRWREQGTPAAKRCRRPCSERACAMQRSELQHTRAPLPVRQSKLTRKPEQGRAQRLPHREPLE